MDDEPHYTPTELFTLYMDFMRDERSRLERNNLHQWEYSEMLLRFLAYVKNYDFERKMQEIHAELKRVAWLNERRKNPLFGEPGDGLLFTEV